MKEKISSADSLEKEFSSAIRSLDKADFLALAAILGSYDEGRGKVAPILSAASSIDLHNAEVSLLTLAELHPEQDYSVALSLVRSFV